jgi:hypothetical protein
MIPRYAGDVCDPRGGVRGVVAGGGVLTLRENTLKKGTFSLFSRPALAAKPGIKKMGGPVPVIAAGTACAAAGPGTCRTRYGTFFSPVDRETLISRATTISYHAGTCAASQGDIRLFLLFCYMHPVSPLYFFLHVLRMQ